MAKSIQFAENTNSRRSIYRNSNMTPRLMGKNKKIFTTPLSRKTQKRLEHKEN